MCMHAYISIKHIQMCIYQQHHQLPVSILQTWLANMWYRSYQFLNKYEKELNKYNRLIHMVPRRMNSAFWSGITGCFLGNGTFRKSQLRNHLFACFYLWKITSDSDKYKLAGSALVLKQVFLIQYNREAQQSAKMAKMLFSL